MNDTTTVSTRGLTKHYGEIHAVGGVDLTVPARDVYRLLTVPAALLSAA